ncbi:MAG: TadE/TadG family type IV pilus assembly protein [Planctomycetota bacterium]|jgi:hypothetical protein
MTEMQGAKSPRSGASRSAALVGVAVLAATLGVVAGWWTSRPQGWLLRGLSSALAVVCGLAVIGCFVLLAIVGAALWRAGLAQRLRRKASAGGNDRGTVMIEFALVLPIILMLVLVMIQSTLLMAGNLCVHYAAYCAARTAIVTIPDGPRQPDHKLPQAPEGPNVLRYYHFSLREGGSEKTNRIWRAAIWAVLPVSSSSPDIPEADARSLTDGLWNFFAGYGMDAPWWATGVIARKLRYARDYTAIYVEPPAAGDRYGDNEDITVRVEHTLYLAVPYASRLFSAFAGGQRLDFGAGEYGTVVSASCRLTNEGVQDYVEEESLLGG